jgi:hypothetical protein
MTERDQSLEEEVRDDLPEREGMPEGDPPLEEVPKQASTEPGLPPPRD